MRKLIFLFSLFTCLQQAGFSLLTLNAQTTLEWAKTYSNPSGMSTWVLAMTIDTLGNTYITGGFNTLIENTNFITIKYNSAGDTEWVKTYNGPGTNSVDYATAIAVDKYGNVYVTGISEETGWLTNAYCTIKYNSSGVQQWVARYKYYPNGEDEPSAIAVDGLGNVYVTGTSYSPSSLRDYSTIKYNSNGDSLWVRRYNGDGNNNDRSNTMYLDKFGNVYVGGYSYGGPYLVNRACLIKYSTAGVQQWISLLNNISNFSSLVKIEMDTLTNDIYGCGGISTNYGDFLAIKFNSEGVLQWFRSYDGTAHSSDYARDLAIDNNHNIYLTGWAYFGTGSTREDYTTIKYNSFGDSLWVRKYNGTGNYNDQCNAIALDKYNNVYITGISDGVGGRDFATIKYSSTGSEQWVMRYPGGGIGIAADKLLNVYVTGGGRNAKDVITIKYSQVDGIIPISQNVPDGFNLYQNYPNPFNSNTKIKLSISKKSFIQLNIYDVLGRIKEILINKELNTSVYEIAFNGNNYASGVYFYQLLADNQIIDTKKLIIVK